MSGHRRRGIHGLTDPRAVDAVRLLIGLALLCWCVLLVAGSLINTLIWH